MTDHLRLVHKRDGSVTHQEIESATEMLMEQIREIAEQTGLSPGELTRSDIFGLHTLAYVVALRHTTVHVHERATGLLFRLLQREDAHRELALRALGDLYRVSMPEQPSLHVVRD